MVKKTILIVEDETGIREMNQKFLTKEGYHVVTAENGIKALEKLSDVKPDLILLDIEMPGMDGFTVCQKIRERMSIPIIFLTVRRATFDKVKCFDLGGDDYMTKPFEFEELGARIKANIRRYYIYPKPKTEILKFDRLEIHLHNYSCYLDGKLIELTTKQMEILIYLAKHPNQVLSREQLYNHVWSLDGTGNIETVKVHISYLRRKLEKDHTKPELIKTVHGFGYVFKG